MAHFGVLSYKGPGHLNPLITLSRALVARGHKVTFFHDPALEARIRPHGLEFVAIAGSKQDSGEHVGAGRRDKPSSSMPLLRYRIRRTINDMERFLRETPLVVTRAGVDALIIDELALAGPTIAEMSCLPYFVISTSVPHNFGWSAPRNIAPRKSICARVQSALLEISVLEMRGPVCRRLDNFRRQAGLGPIRQIKQTFPELAHITQLPQCLDLPRSGLPPTFYYTGPFVDEAARLPIAFPWDRLDGRPMIYASLGTTLKADSAMFYLVAEACDGLGVQLVISLGGRRDPAMLRDFPGRPLVVREAPQLELLKKAKLVITHAGPNTVFETLMQGRPMIAIPMTFDQPAIAARLARLGAAIVLRPGKLSVQKVRSALIAVLHEPSYRNAAIGLQARINSAHGLKHAADLIEQALGIPAGGFTHSDV